MNTFGRHIRVTTFGESHGTGLGCVVDGIPAGLSFDEALLRTALARRRPGQELSSARREPDVPEILSGIFEGVTLGTPIALLVRNADQRSKDYDDLRDLYRPSHADFTYDRKYGHRDHRGGGRSSARETLARVAAGAFARMLVTASDSVSVHSCVTRIADVVAKSDPGSFDEADIYESVVRQPDAPIESEMIAAIEQARSDGDSLGGIVSTTVQGVPIGLGEPIYGKLNGMLGAAMMSINGAVGFSVGDGFAATRRRGSEQNDGWISDEQSGELRTRTNHGGGISGGISNGMPVHFAVGFKPPSSIAKVQEHGTKKGGTARYTIQGRHDPTIVVRAVSVVEAMTWLVLADRLLAARLGTVASD